jgi:hypothetical protein
MKNLMIFQAKSVKEIKILFGGKKNNNDGLNDCAGISIVGIRS